MNIAEIILAKGESGAPAVLFKDVVVTYDQLRRRVAEIAGLLRSRAGEGDRIGLFSENNPFFVSAYLGIIRAGMVAVPFQTELPEGTFHKIASEAGIRNVFVSARFAARIRPWCDKTGVALSVDGEAWSVGEARPQMDRAQPQMDTDSRRCGNVDAGQSSAASQLSTLNSQPPDRIPRLSTLNSQPLLAALMFTSGSTGEPKGVMISHRNIECNTRDIIQYMGLTAQDRVMVVLPFHYCFGMSLLHTHLLAGGSLVLNNDFKLYPETVLREMQQRECTGIAGVPSTYQILLRKSRFREMEFPKLRWFQQAGGKLPNPCIAEIRSAFPQVKYFLMYGQTEGTARLSYLPPERLDDKLGSIGKGLPSTRLEVVRTNGTPVGSSKLQAPSSRETSICKHQGPGAGLQDNRTTGLHDQGRRQGQESEPITPSLHHSITLGRQDSDSDVGEIVASGDNIALGYWNDPTETARFFRDGKLYTGDLARVDQDGFIFIVERERDMIKSGGNRVSAKEVEDVIAEITEVVEVAVVGAPHELLGESIIAFTVMAPRAALSTTDIQRHCRRRLPAFKVPEEILFLKAMPHNGAGKVMKTELKKMAAGTSHAKDATDAKEGKTVE